MREAIVIRVNFSRLFWNTIVSYSKKKNERNQLSKLRRHTSQVHFASNSFGPIHFAFRIFQAFTLEHGGVHVGHLVHLHVGHVVGHYVS